MADEKSCRALIVDNSELFTDFRLLLVQTLEALGIESIVVEKVAQANECLQSETYELVFMDQDIGRPGELENVTAPIIALSYVDDAAQRHALKKLGFRHLLARFHGPEHILFVTNNILYDYSSTFRRKPRALADLVVTYSVRGDVIRARTTNLSEGGLYIKSFVLPGEGSNLELSLAIPNAAGSITPTKCIGQVVHKRPYHYSKYLYPPGAGIRFSLVEDEDQQTILNYMQHAVWTW